jgi:undecaprenyl-diphosphatase
MLEQITLGIIQGITEWFPVSSEGMIFLAKTGLFHHELHYELFVKEALFLHLGTLLAAVLFFRREVLLILLTLIHYRASAPEAKRLFNFLFISTLLSGLLGIILLKALAGIFEQISTATNGINLLVGCLLLITGGLLLKAKNIGSRTMDSLLVSDATLLGIVQGFATLPGLSRSGLTVSALLLKKFDKTQALKISFLMNIPIVALGNMALNVADLHFSWPALAGLSASFLAGIATIHLLFKLVPRINFGYFVAGFGLLVILATLIQNSF